MIESEEIEEEIDVDFDTKSQHASRKGIEENGGRLRSGREPSKGS